MNLVLNGGWTASAACRGMDPAVFHPQRHGHDQAKRSRAAKEVCRRCPVEDECLAFALMTEPVGSESGIWGGMTPEERRELRRLLERSEPEVQVAGIGGLVSAS